MPGPCALAVASPAVASCALTARCPELHSWNRHLLPRPAAAAHLVTCPGALSCPRALPHTPECPSQDKPAAAQAKLNDKASSPPSALPPPCHWASPRCSCLIKAQPWGWPSPVPTGAVLSGRRGLGPRTGPYSRGGPPESRRPDSCLGGGGPGCLHRCWRRQRQGTSVGRDTRGCQLPYGPLRALGPTVVPVSPSGSWPIL